MKSMETACRELESVPYMGHRQAGIVKRLLNEYKFKSALEIGFYHGKSSVLIASVFEEMGEGHLLTYDVESARDRDPNIIQLLDAYNLSHRVTPVFCQRSYTWELAKLLKNSKGPVFDFCYLDGGHTWDCTGYGFFLIDLLLKPGGIIIFDDMDWTINTSPFYKKSLQEGNDPYIKYSDEEKNTPAVRMVFENLIPSRGYGRTEVKDVNWGIAIKL